MRRRLLFVISNFHPAVGGAELQAGLLAAALGDLGIEVEVLTAAIADLPSRERVRGVLVHRAIRLVRAPGLWGASHALGTWRFLSRFGEQFGGILGFQLQAFHNPPAIRWGRARRKPVVVRGSGTGDDGDVAELARMPSGRLLRAELRAAAAYVALTEEMREQMAGIGLDPARIVVLPNGVETARFALAAAEERDPLALLAAGRLTPRKGLDDLIDAVALLVAEGRPVTLRIVGDGTERERLRARAESRGLSAAVSFPGWRDDLRPEFAHGGVFVLPSLGEGMSNVLLEAMASGCPVVASDIAANREVVRHGASGLLAPVRDPAALAGALRRIIDDRGLARALGEGARARVEERFSLPAVARGYRELFERLWADRG